MNRYKGLVELEINLIYNPVILILIKINLWFFKSNLKWILSRL